MPPPARAPVSMTSCAMPATSVTWHVFGLKACDTCRRAQAWLGNQSLTFEFHDLRQSPLKPHQLDDWLASPLSALLLNRRSTTWRQLSAAQQQQADTDLAGLLLEHPALLKRPLLVRGSELVAVGFEPGQWAALL